MKITVDGTTYELALTGRFAVQEVIAIEDYTCLPLDVWGELLKKPDEDDDDAAARRRDYPPSTRTKCLVALVWLARHRAGDKVPIGKVDFDINTLDIDDEGDGEAEDEPVDPPLPVEPAAP